MKDLLQNKKLQLRYELSPPDRLWNHTDREWVKRTQLVSLVYERAPADRGSSLALYLGPIRIALWVGKKK